MQLNPETESRPSDIKYSYIMTFMTHNRDPEEPLYIVGRAMSCPNHNPFVGLNLSGIQDSMLLGEMGQDPEQDYCVLFHNSDKDKDTRAFIIPWGETLITFLDYQNLTFEGEIYRVLASIDELNVHLHFPSSGIFSKLVDKNKGIRPDCHMLSKRSGFIDYELIGVSEEFTSLLLGI